MKSKRSEVKLMVIKWSHLTFDGKCLKEAGHNGVFYLLEMEQGLAAAGTSATSKNCSSVCAFRFTRYEVRLIAYTTFCLEMHRQE